MSSKKHFLAGLSSYVIWGFVPLLFKELSAFDDYEIIFYRVFVAALAMAVVFSMDWKASWNAVADVFRQSQKDFWIMMTLTLVGGALLMVNWVTYVYVVNHVSIHGAAFAYLILPIATTFLAFFILGEKLNKNKWAGIVLSGISCYLMANVDVNQILYIAAITLSYSFYMITQRRNLYVNRRISLSMQMVAGVLMMLLIDPIKTPVGELDFHFWLFVSLIALFFTITPLLLNLFALNGMESSQLAFLIYVNPIISFVIGVTIYGEELDWLAVTAYSLMAIAIVIFNWELIGHAAKKSGLYKSQESVKKVA
ncbi:EamA family transporter [bacterium]|nr:EamA family transporter [bacterium]